MAITIELRPDEEQMLGECARASGQELTEYIRQVLEQHVRSASHPDALDQILAPVRESWRESGLTDEQINARLQRDLEQIRRERLERTGME
jgi:hypothetical protein